MKIAVCIKQVPDTTARIKVKDDGSGISEEGLKYVVSPYDEFALEEALRLKEKNPGTETLVVSVGPKRVTDALRTALAMGIDKAIHVQVDGYLDSLATAKLLAQVLKREAVTLTLTGRQAIDTDQSQVSQMLAELIGVAHVTVVSKLERLSETSLQVERDTDGGNKEVWTLTLPALIAATKGLNEPRYASLKGIMAAKSKPIETLTPEALGGLPQNKLRLGRWSAPEQKRVGKIFKEDAASAAQKVVQLLRDEAKVI